MNNNILNHPKEYAEYCSNGFLLSTESYLMSWDYIKFVDYFFYHSPRTVYNFKHGAGGSILIVGKAYDLIDKKKTDDVLITLSRKLEKSLGEAINYLSYLAGRFLIIVVKNNKTYIFPDSHCTYACYWSSEKKGVFSSHLQIFKDNLGCSENEILSQIMTHPDYIEPGGKYFPASLTPLKTVYPLIANCFLEFDGHQTLHKRFYPVISLKEKFECVSKDDLYLRFKEYLVTSLKLSFEDGNSYISLTNGFDSRAILAASILANLKYDSFTYCKFGIKNSHYENDLVGASRLATHAGISHFILKLPDLDYGSNFYQMYKKTFSLYARFPTLAQAYYEQLPEMANVIVSTISETGTVFYTKRDDKDLNAKVLAKKWTTSAISAYEPVIAAFEDYIKYTQFYLKNTLDFDFYDLFYWEHRNSKWGNLWYQECDLSHSVILPFNCRLINEIMLSFNFEDRKNKYLLNRLILDAGLSPESNAYI